MPFRSFSQTSLLLRHASFVRSRVRAVRLRQKVRLGSMIVRRASAAKCTPPYHCHPFYRRSQGSDVRKNDMGVCQNGRTRWGGLAKLGCHRCSSRRVVGAKLNEGNLMTALKLPVFKRPSFSTTRCYQAGMPQKNVFAVFETQVDGPASAQRGMRSLRTMSSSTGTRRTIPFVNYCKSPITTPFVSRLSLPRSCQYEQLRFPYINYPSNSKLYSCTAHLITPGPRDTEALLT